MNPPQKTMPLNLKSLRTRFALRFLRALREINLQQRVLTLQNKGTNNNHGFMVSTPLIRSYHKVKLAADASLASAVGPRRTWSRALLFRVRPSKRALARRRRRRRRLRRTREEKESESQAEELRRLVPGGESMDLNKLLDETAHYVKCLATQVKVMRSIVTYCSSSTT